jgi:hypothetical protein
MMVRIICSVSLSLGLLACGNDQPDGATNTGGSAGASAGLVMLQGRCEAGTRLGGFELAMESDFSAISGAVYDRLARSALNEAVASDESCALVKRTNPFCDPPCSGGRVCVQGGACEAAPTSLDLGAVAVQGLTAPLTMSPTQPGNRYFSTGLEHPPVAPASPVSLQAEGGELGPFELHAEGVSLLETSDNAWLVERGKALEITWTASPAPGQARVRATLNIDQHGSSPVTLSCVASDTGSLAISSHVIDELLDFGVSGFATGNIYRETSDHVVFDRGCVDFALSAHRKRMLEVAGHQACTKDADCEDGKACDLPTNTCG